MNAADTSLRRRLWRVAAAVVGGTLVSNSASANDNQNHLEDAIDTDVFHRQGYVLIPGFATADEVAAIRADVDNIVNAWDGPARLNASLSLRSAGSNASSSSSVDHSYFIDSATKASFFLEGSALDTVDENKLRPGISKKQALRKLGHGLHLAEDAKSIRSLLHSNGLSRMISRLGWRRPVIVQCLYRFGQPFAAGVDRHQDSTFFVTQPLSCLGLWLALEDARLDTGCLHIRPGSHAEPLRERMVRKDQGDGVQISFERLANASDATEDDFVAVPVSRGDLLIMHGQLDHFSASGVAAGQSRESLQVHVVEADAVWAADNWIKYPPGMEFERLGSNTASFAGRAKVMEL